MAVRVALLLLVALTAVVCATQENARDMEAAGAGEAVDVVAAVDEDRPAVDCDTADCGGVAAARVLQANTKSSTRTRTFTRSRSAATRSRTRSRTKSKRVCSSRVCCLPGLLTLALL